MYNVSKYISFGFVNDEAMIHNFLTKKSILLKNNSIYIWLCIVEGLNINEIVNNCCKKYGMDDRIIVENDVTNFICELAKMQFVQII